MSDSDQLNADLPKASIRNAFLRSLRPSRLARAAQACAGKQSEVDRLAQRLLMAAEETAMQPVLDAPRLHAGRAALLAGLGALGLGACTRAWVQIDGTEGFLGAALNAAAGGLVVSGAWLAWTGRSLRRQQHLPAVVTPQQIDAARALLHSTGESARAPASTRSMHTVGGLMVADSAILLGLAAPALMPDAQPIVHLGVVAVGALLAARISLEAISAIARAVRVAQVRADQALAAIGDGPSQLRAVALRATFGGALGGNWPVSVGWRAYLPAAFWALPLVGLQLLLLGVRLAAGESAADAMLPMLIAGTMALLTTLFCLRSAVLSEHLVPEVADAKRLLSRFPSVEQFQAMQQADRARLDRELADAAAVLAATLQPQQQGVSQPRPPALKLSGSAATSAVAQPLATLSLVAQS